MNHDEIIDRARSYAASWEFHAPQRITRSHSFEKGAFWFPPPECHIEIGSKQCESVLPHEIFHGAYHSSPLRRTDDAWGEAFCNAFAMYEYEGGRTYGISDDLYYMAKTDAWMRVYGLPHFLLANYCKSREGFRSLWFWANQVSRFYYLEWFSAFMGYDPATGDRLNADGTLYYPADSLDSFEGCQK